MAKMRGFKPDLWTDEDFVEVSSFARLLWLGMWNFACDNGHLADRSKQIKMRVLPTDDVNCAELLRELQDQGLIIRENGWITVPNLTFHQKPNRRYFTTCEKPGCTRPAENPEREIPGAQRGTTLRKVEKAKAPCDGDGDGDGDSKKTSSTAAPLTVVSRFDEFWSVYPKKVEKAGAKKIFDRLSKKLDPQTLIDGADRYAKDPRRKKEFTKNPTTWLNNGCWDDETSTATERPRTADGRLWLGDW